MAVVTRALGGLTLILICAACVVFNILLVIVFCRRKRVRTPTGVFVFVLGIVDLTGFITWSLYSVIAVVDGDWTIPYGLCEFQEYFWGFCNLVNMHVLCIMALERCLLIFKPSKLQEISSFRVVLLLLTGFAIFDAVNAAYPAMTWGEVAYSAKVYQCIPRYEQNVRHMNFMLALVFGIPVCVTVFAYTATYIRLAYLRKRMTSFGAIVLEENDQATGDSYANRLRNEQLKFQNAGMKAKKPKLNDKPVIYTSDGYLSDLQESSDEDDSITPEMSKNVKKKCYYLSNNDFILIRTFLLSTSIYVLCWLPYVILTYVWTYSMAIVIPDTVFIIVGWLVHCGGFVKPLVYVVSCPNYRQAFIKTFNRKSYYKGKTTQDVPEKGDKDEPSVDMKNFLI